MKYRLTDESREVTKKSTGEKITVYQIESVETPYMRAFDRRKNVKGGWVESEENLSQYGSCWICPKTVVIENARVEGDATISNSHIGGDVVVTGSATVQKSVLMGSGSIHGENLLRGVGLTEGSSMYINGENRLENVRVEGTLVISHSGLSVNKCSFFGENKLFSNGKLENSEFKNLVMDCTELDIQDSKLSSKEPGHLYHKVKMKHVKLSTEKLLLNRKIELEYVYGFNLKSFIAKRFATVRGTFFGEGSDILFTEDTEPKTYMYSEQLSEARIRGERNLELEQDNPLAYSIRCMAGFMEIGKGHWQGNLIISGNWIMENVSIQASGNEIIGGEHHMHELENVFIKDFASIDFSGCKTEQTLKKAKLVDDMKIMEGSA